MTATGFRTTLLRKSLATLCAVSASAMPILAEEIYVAQRHASDVVEDTVAWSPPANDADGSLAAGQLWNLSQKISALSCHMSQDVAPTESRAQLAETAMRFGQALTALEEAASQATLLSPMSNSGVLADLEAVKNLWTPVRGAIPVLSETPNDPMAMSLVSAGSEVLMGLTNGLFEKVLSVSAEQSNASAHKAISLDFAGQQAAQLQEISKMACEIWAGDRSAQKMKAFADANWIVTEAFAGLRLGRPSMGLMAPPTSQIKSELNTVITDWRNLKVFVEGMMEEDVSMPIKRLLFERLNGMEPKLAYISQLYAEQ